MSFIGSEFTTTQILSLSILSANEIQLLLTLQESSFKKKVEVQWPLSKYVFKS